MAIEDRPLKMSANKSIPIISGQKIMRLSTDQVSAIKNVGITVFGNKSEIWLFGSRADDSKKGGDIDLLILPAADTAAPSLKKKVRFLTELELLLGQQKIDVVIGLPGDTRPIVKIAKERGILL